MSPFLETFANASVRGWRVPSNGSGPAYELISTQVLSSTQGEITFSSIPQTYKHLQIRVAAKSDRGGSFEIMYMRINGATTGYSTHALFGDGDSSTVYSGNQPGANNIQVGWVAGSTTTGLFGSAIIDIPDAFSTVKNKTVKSLSGYTGGTPRVYLYSGAWYSTAAITSLSFLSNYSASFIAGTRISIYGIKG